MRGKALIGMSIHKKGYRVSEISLCTLWKKFLSEGVARNGWGEVVAGSSRNGGRISLRNSVMKRWEYAAFSQMLT